jgi:hypothetical protein
MRTITFIKQGELLQLIWGNDETPTTAPSEGGRTVQPWEELDGKLAEDYEDGEHEVSAEHREPPEPLEATLFLKDQGRFAILWDEQLDDNDELVDMVRTVNADALIDGKRAGDYPDGVHVVTDSNRKEA